MIRRIEGLDVRDVRSLNAARYDVVVTDPPYGFSTSTIAEELATLYDLALKAVVGSAAVPARFFTLLRGEDFGRMLLSASKDCST